MKMGSKKLTPAQRLGITDKEFDLNDIIYFNKKDISITIII